MMSTDPRIKHALKASPRAQELFRRAQELGVDIGEPRFRFDKTVPDIDIDLSSRARDEVFDYLAEKYGAANVARIGNLSTMQPRSVLAQCGKHLGIPEPATRNVRNNLVQYSSGDARFGHALEDTLEETEPGQELLAKHPEAVLMYEAEGTASHTSVHAAGVIVAPKPLTDFAIVRNGVLQLEKTGAENLNLLKIDALGLRTLEILENTGVVEPDTLYNLPLNDQDAFDVLNQGRFSGVFQFEGDAQRRLTADLWIRDFQTMDHCTALARPGPLQSGAAAKYIRRFHGDEPTTFLHPALEPIIGETFGVLLYQEQVMRICREIGGFSWADVTEIRRGVSKSKGAAWLSRWADRFAAGAERVHGMPREDSLELWNEITAFGGYGMNKNHTVAYAIISYWCCWVKSRYPLEWSAALLRHTTGNDQTLEVLRELRAEGIDAVLFDLKRSRAEWSVQDGKLIGGWRNLTGVGPVLAAKYAANPPAELPARHRLSFPSLDATWDRWGYLYTEDGAARAIPPMKAPAKQINDLEDGETSRIVCLLRKRQRRDRNEADLRKRRGGTFWRSQPLFLDLWVTDDSVSRPVRVRINEKDWHRWGKPIADNGRDDEDWFLVRGRWLEDARMLLAGRIHCLSRDDLLEQSNQKK